MYLNFVKNYIGIFLEAAKMIFFKLDMNNLPELYQHTRELISTQNV